MKPSASLFKIIFVSLLGKRARFTFFPSFFSSVQGSALGPSTTTMESPSAESFKELGNALFNGKDLLNALEAYSKGIIQDPRNYILFSNRSRCNAALEDFEAALAGETFPLA